MKRAYTLPVNETTRLPLSYTFILFYFLQLFPCRVYVCVCHRCVYIADVRTVDACVDVLCSYMCCKCVSSFVISFFSQHVDSFSLSLFIFLSSRDLNNVRAQEGKFVSFIFFYRFFTSTCRLLLLFFFSYFFHLSSETQAPETRNFLSRRNTVGPFRFHSLFGIRFYSPRFDLIVCVSFRKCFARECLPSGVVW